MIEPRRFVDRLAELGVTDYVGVPDSLLKSLCTELMATLPRERHVIAANEGAAVGMAIGAWLRTGRPSVVYLQNSGFGNTVNPLLSLADPDVYGVPMLLVVGWRGQAGVRDEPQHVKQGRVMGTLLDALELPWSTLATDADTADEQLADAVATAEAKSCPYVLMVEKGTFGDPSEELDRTDDERLPTREAALAAAVAAIGDDAVTVSTTGMLSRELFEHREATGGGERDFLTVGGMGHACSIALGVALHEPQREVWCLDGDGALLMHLGSLATIAEHAPPSFFHVVFNNGVHDSVGGQPTSIGTVDVPATAQALGYRFAAATGDPAELPALIAQVRAHGGPSLLELRVRPGNRADLGRPTRTPRQSRDAFTAALR